MVWYLASFTADPWWCMRAFHGWSITTLKRCVIPENSLNQLHREAAPVSFPLGEGPSGRERAGCPGRVGAVRGFGVRELCRLHKSNPLLFYGTSLASSTSVNWGKNLGHFMTSVSAVLTQAMYSTSPCKYWEAHVHRK